MVLDVLLPVFGRSLYGWLKNSLADGKIQPVEWFKLLESLVQMGLLAFLLWQGLGQDASASAALGALLHFLKGEFKNVFSF